jgi:type II secretory pathway pseudopilin PulG
VHKLRAHTLLEMMVVVIILAVMAGASVPRLQWFAASSGFENDVSLVTNFLVQAQKRALLEHQQWMVKIDPAQRTFSLCPTGHDTDDAQSFLSGDAPKSLKVDDDMRVESSVNQIFFYPDGHISSARVRLSGQRHSIVLSTDKEWGKVSLLKDQGADGND